MHPLHLTPLFLKFINVLMDKQCLALSLFEIVFISVFLGDIVTIFFDLGFLEMSLVLVN